MNSSVPDKLIIAKGEDITPNVRSIKSIPGTGKLAVTFNNGKRYEYNAGNIAIHEQNDRFVLDNGEVVIVDGFARFEYKEVQVFGPYLRLIEGNGKYRTIESYKVRMLVRDQNTPTPKDRFDYLKTLAEETGLVVNNVNILAYNYSKIGQVSTESVLFDYLNGNEQAKNESWANAIVYPFGFNHSQKKAVENALHNKVSIIEGPPGTGKTQTILNIIANALINNKTVAVVSNNNTAIRNVFDKLEKNNVEFVSAVLGSRDNKTLFTENQSLEIPQIEQWKSYSAEQSNNLRRINQEEKTLNKKLEVKNTLAGLIQEHDSLSKERFYYDKVPKESSESNPVVFKHGITADEVMLFRAEYEYLKTQGGSLGLLRKIKWYFKYGIKRFDFFNQTPQEVVDDYCDSIFYDYKINELNKEITRLSGELDNYAFDQHMEEYSGLSMDVLKGVLANKYPNCRHAGAYTLADMKRNSEEFASDYPVILSTTYSLRSCLDSYFVYDYVIIDEASQVDLVTGALALSCAKKAVIVGDLKQLPNVVDKKTREKVARISAEYNIDDRYDYTKHSILSSIKSVFDNAPEVMLKEHYRCAPEIINFCNKRFYDNKLVVLTEKREDRQPMKVYRTVAGNHARDHFNQRQIEVIRDEVLPSLKLKDGETVGIVTPYRKQADAMKKIFADTDIQADTVDKYQGQERNIMIFSTVDNEIGDFASNPNRLNVAVSRAIDQFIVVTNGNDNDNSSPIADLIGYIKYNNYEIVDSNISSVFDNLYKNHEEARLRIIKKYGSVSEYDSENLMYNLIKDELSDPSCSKYDVSVHVPLRHIIKDRSRLDQREAEFVGNPNSHLDFLVYSRIDQKPVLAIEVDGFKYHHNNEIQEERDLVKNSILGKYSIPLIRFSTIGSQEQERLKDALEQLS